MLKEFVAANREEIIRRCRAKVATRVDPLPTEAEINYGVPLFLDQLVETLRLGLSSTPEIRTTAVLHGRDLLAKGFTVSQVVYDYGDVCQSITDLAVETEKAISAADFRTLNRCLDDAIAGAVTEFGHEKNQWGDGSEHLDELRTLLDTTLVAFKVIKKGNVGVGGSTGAVLHRSLMELGAVIDRERAKHWDSK